MLRFLKIIFKTLLALALGLVFAIIVLQEDPWFKAKIEQKMVAVMAPYLEKGCDVKLQKINIFLGRVEFSSLRAKSEENNWYFSCPVFTIDVSWYSLIFGSKIIADFTFYYTQIKSQMINGHMNIVTPIKAFLEAPSDLPITVRNVAFRHLSVNAFDISKNIDIKLLLSFDSLINNIIDTKISFVDGVIEYRLMPYVKKISGNMHLISNFDELSKVYNHNLQSHLIADFSVSNSDYQKIKILYNYKNRSGNLEAYTEDNLLNINLNDIKISDEILFDLSVKTNSQKVAELGIFDLLNLKPFYISYDLNMLSKISLSKDKVLHTSQLNLDNLVYQDYNIKKLTINAKGDASLSNANFEIENLEGANFSGIFKLDLNNSIISSDFFLKNPVDIKSVNIKTGVFNAKLNLNTNEFASDYRIKFDYLKTNHKADGKLTYFENNLKTNGFINSYKYNIECLLKPLVLRVFSLNYGIINLVNLEKLKNSNDNVSGFIDYKFIKELINKFFGYDLQGQAKINLDGKIKSDNINLNINVNDANIRLANSSNVVKSLKTNLEVDLSSSVAKFNNLTVNLHKGKLNSLCSTINYSNSGDILYAHCPVNFYNCLINWEKDFFGLISGSLTLNYKNNDQSFIKGNLILEKSHLKGNILSSDLQKKLFSNSVKSLNSYNKNINLDIKFETKNDISIKASLLNTKAKVNLDLKGTFLNPEFSGEIQLVNGFFDLPYKPLYIQFGKIYIFANQLYDPTIELVAKNKIKKYNVTMTIRGSLQEPKISFECSPNLQEEQIITLLLSGSEQGSLYLLMPNIMLQNIENLILGSDAKSSNVQDYLKKFLKPLKNVRLIPGQVKDNGKTEMQGAIEFDINDRLTAKIQNNLDLSGQTELELEYNISDDITIKATKDQKSGIGSELEMRWKF